MFFGTYEHSLDEKGRLKVPSKLKDKCSERIYILKGYDGALSVFNDTDFEKLTIEASNLPFNQKANRDYLRAQLASACELEFDKAGRIQLPSYILSKFGISKCVVVIGVGDHFEIWDKDSYSKYAKEVDDNFESIAEGITRKDV